MAVKQSIIIASVFLLVVLVNEGELYIYIYNFFLLQIIYGDESYLLVELKIMNIECLLIDQYVGVIDVLKCISLSNVILNAALQFKTICIYRCFPNTISKFI